MTDRQFRLLLGPALFLLLYVDGTTGMGVLVGYLVFEGITNWRAPLLISRCFHVGEARGCSVQTVNVCAPVRTLFEAERALRLMIAIILPLSVFACSLQLWWMSWFVAFAVIGAGVSGICPMLTSSRMPGFR